MNTKNTATGSLLLCLGISYAVSMPPHAFLMQGGKIAKSKSQTRNKLGLKMTDDLTQAISQIENRLAVALSTPPERTLWTLRRVLDYLEVSANTLKGYKDFPKPISMTDRSSGNRWIAKEVQEWAIARRFQPGKPRAA